MNELSLFSGYGGFSLGLRLVGIDIRTVGYVEIDPYCQQLIRARICDGLLDWAPIITDVCTASFEPMAGLVDIITAGFPCQPHSSAGKRRGKKDARNLWPDTLRIIRTVGPRFVLLENVRGLADGNNPYAAEILGQLSEAGYDAVWGLIPAAAVGAPHLRWRWWCFAYATGDRCHTGRWPTKSESQYKTLVGTQQFGSDGCSRLVANTQGQHEIGDSSKGGAAVAQTQSGGLGGGNVSDWWAIEPDMGRVADGVAYRVDRLKALGNGIVPPVVGEFLRRIGV